MNCYGQTSEGVKFENVKNENFLELILMNMFLIQYKKSWQKAERVRICKFMTIERRRMLMITFIESQFCYCYLVWIFVAIEVAIIA